MAGRSDLYMGDLMLKIITHQTGEISHVDFKSEKIPFPASDPLETTLPRKTPEETGVSSVWVSRLLRTLGEHPECSMHKIMIARKGAVIASCGYGPFDPDLWHISHSMCKTVTGMAIGLLISEGKLSLTDRVTDILSRQVSLFGMFRPKDLTIRHLLTMSSGVSYNESGALSGNTWTKAFLEASTSFAPGSRFEYNSMNSYMLSAIVTEVTGESLFDYVRSRILDPLGIRRILWESSPERITKGGWGMFIRMEDMVKLGMLYLQKGCWNSQQILPEEWVLEATSPQIETGLEGASHYGYQLWTSDYRPGAYTYNGMLGQSVYVYPDLDMVIATNAGNSEVFQKGTMTTIIGNAVRDLEVAEELPPDFGALQELKAVCRSLGGQDARILMVSRGGWPAKRDHRRLQTPLRARNRDLSAWKRILDGTVYDLSVTGVGIFPLMMQVFHNNFTDGIRSIGFRLDLHGRLYLELYEGAEVYSLPCCFEGNPEAVEIWVHGDTYRVAVKSIFTGDEYGRMVLRNEILFLEEANCRELNFYFDPDRSGRLSAPETIGITMDETPGSEMIISSMKGVSAEGGIEGFLMNKLQGIGAMNALNETVRRTIRPHMKGVLHHDTNEECENPDDAGDSGEQTPADSVGGTVD